MFEGCIKRNIARQGLLKGIHNVFQAFGQFDDVAFFIFRNNNEQTLLPIKSADVQVIGIVVMHIGDVLQINQFFAVAVHHGLPNRFDIFVAAAGLDTERFVVCRNIAAGNVGVVLFEHSHHLLQGNIHLRHFCKIQRYPHLLFGICHQLYRADSFLTFDAILQFFGIIQHASVRSGFGGHGDLQNGHILRRCDTGFQTGEVLRQLIADVVDFAQYFVINLIDINAKRSIGADDCQPFGNGGDNFLDILNLVDGFFQRIDHQLFHIFRTGAGINCHNNISRKR